MRESLQRRLSGTSAAVETTKKKYRKNNGKLSSSTATLDSQSQRRKNFKGKIYIKRSTQQKGCGNLATTKTINKKLQTKKKHTDTLKANSFSAQILLWFYVLLYNVFDCQLLTSKQQKSAPGNSPSTPAGVEKWEASNQL